MQTNGFLTVTQIVTRLSRLVVRVIYGFSDLLLGVADINVFKGGSKSISYKVDTPRKMDIRGRVVVFSILGCPHCMRAKNALNKLGLPYNDINLDTYPSCRQYVKHKTGKNTVPQIFFNSIHVGGEEELQKAVDDKDALKKLVDEVTNNAAGADAPSLPDPATAVQTHGSGTFICEPDEYAKLVIELKQSGIIKDRRSGLSVEKNSFSGKDFVTWLVKTKALDEERALETGQALIDRHFGNDLSKTSTFANDDTLYRLVEDDETTALNALSSDESAMCTRPANELAEEIRRLILKLYSVFLSPDGRKVNYAGIGSSAEFENYKTLVKELVRVDIESGTRQEKLAFFINIYNALVIHANIERGPPANLWQRWKFFNTVRYIIGGHTYSLQDIENGVLRANRKGVGMLSRPFGANDPRLKIALEEPEPLIHFALVCGAKSCPPIKTYSASGVMAQLKVAAESFMEGEDGVSVDRERKEIKLSSIFKWYKVDFGNTMEELLMWIENNMGNNDKKKALCEVIATKKYKVKYLPYDWSVNAKDLK